MVRKQKLIEIAEKRYEDLELLAEALDLPVSVLIRMGITLIVKKYGKELMEAKIGINDRNIRSGKKLPQS